MPRKTASKDISAAHAARHTVRIGVGGWTYAPWRKNFYPDGLVQKRELEYASRHLRVIEINGTFYGAQKPATYARWAAETPEGFVFSLKAPRYITGGKKLADTAMSITAFIEGGLDQMGDRLGPILWQLPPTRRFDADDIDAFLRLLPAKLAKRPLRHVLEVRHSSFLSAEYVALARSHRVPTVFTDSPEYPSLADITGDFTYARLMRSKDGIAMGYSAKDLGAWSKRAQRWAHGKDNPELPHVAAALPDGRARDVFIFFISAAKHRNPAAAMALQARVDAVHQ